MTREKHDTSQDRWQLTREKILMFAGLAVIFYELILADHFGGHFHVEGIIGGLALCGVSITQSWGKEK
jgi:hypothetical protein